MSKRDAYTNNRSNKSLHIQNNKSPPIKELYKNNKNIIFHKRNNSNIIKFHSYKHTEMNNTEKCRIEYFRCRNKSILCLKNSILNLNQRKKSSMNKKSFKESLPKESFKNSDQYIIKLNSNRPRIKNSAKVKIQKKVRLTLPNLLVGEREDSSCQKMQTEEIHSNTNSNNFHGNKNSSKAKKRSKISLKIFLEKHSNNMKTDNNHNYIKKNDSNKSKEKENQSNNIMKRKHIFSIQNSYKNLKEKINNSKIETYSHKIKNSLFPNSKKTNNAENLNLIVKKLRKRKKCNIINNNHIYNKSQIYYLTTTSNKSKENRNCNNNIVISINHFPVENKKVINHHPSNFIEEKENNLFNIIRNNVKKFGKLKLMRRNYSKNGDKFISKNSNNNDCIQYVNTIKKEQIKGPEMTHFFMVSTIQESKIYVIK